MIEPLNLQIVLILTIGFAYASLLGYLTHRLKLSAILGYLLGGYLIGPYSPGYIANLHLAEQLAEIGVILMMFSVGLHFKWQDLVNTGKIAIPGAIGQTLFTALASVLLLRQSGWPLEATIISGLAIGVASTVILVRVLSDNRLLNTPQGHISVEWLIVEDLITIVVLLLIPMLAISTPDKQSSFMQLIATFSLTIFKCLLFVVFMFTYGRKIFSYLMAKVLETNSHELFTLTTLAITFIISVGSAFLIGTSIALGAFIGGMVMGQTTMRHRVAMNVTPLKDVFVVIFFLSIGMLFDPTTILVHFWLFSSVLAIILILKPLVAFLITIILKYPTKVAVTIALALAQIGEFSFILAEQANKVNLLPDQAFDIIIACSLVSISLNPLLFRLTKNYLAVTPSIHEKS